MSKGLSWILTEFDDIEAWSIRHTQVWNTGKCKYMCSQLELSPETNKLHWQIFVKFTTKLRMKQVKDIFGSNSMHCKYVSVERAEAIGYGMKPETRVEGPMEDGVRPKAVDKCSIGGQRTKEEWDKIKDLVKEGKMDEIPTDVMFRFNLEARFRNLKKIWTKDERLSLPDFLPNPWGILLPSKVPSKKRHYWIFSRQPNKGKTTKFARPIVEQYKAHIKESGWEYWDLRGDEECVILDEVGGGTFKHTTLNSMANGGFDFKIFHGGMVRLNNPLIIVLSNESIREVFPFKYETVLARFIEHEIL